MFLLSRSPGYVFVPQPYMAGFAAPNNVPGGMGNSDNQERFVAMSSSPMHPEFQRWLEVQSQIFAAQRTSAVGGSNQLYPQVPLYGLNSFNMNHSDQISPARGAVEDNSQSPSTSSQSLDQAINNYSGILNIQQLLLRQKIEVIG